MRKFGLIGFPLTHSFSKKYFTGIFEREGVNAVYENFPMEDISGLPELVSREGPEGLNVTIPHKEHVIPFLHECTDAVREIGACNCISIRHGVWKGHNTDVTGFEESLVRQLRSSHDRALVLGTGGAAKAVVYVLRKLGIPFLWVSRTPAEGQVGYEMLDQDLVSSRKLIINTTPLGMFPKTDECPSLPYDAIGRGHYLYDLVYNPEKTLFLQKGEERGAVIANGYDMLLIQANESRKIWGV